MGRNIIEVFKVNDKLCMIESVEDFREGGFIEKVGGLTNYGVLKTLIAHMDNNGECYPSISTIAKILCVSDKTVTRTLKDLEERGFITKEQVKLKGVRQLHNKYTIVNGVKNLTESEDKGSISDRLLAHFKNSFRNKYHKEYKSEFLVNDLRQLDTLYEECGCDFEYACKIIDKHIDTYTSNDRRYPLPNVYFLVNVRLTSMKRELTKEENIKNKEAREVAIKNKNVLDFLGDTEEEIEVIKESELSFLSERDKKRREIDNF